MIKKPKLKKQKDSTLADGHMIRESAELGLRSKSMYLQNLFSIFFRDEYMEVCQSILFFLTRPAFRRKYFTRGIGAGKACDKIQTHS